MKQHTVEFYEEGNCWELVRWSDWDSVCNRTGKVIDKFYSQQAALEVCEFYNDTQLPDVGCEFNSRYDDQFEIEQ